MRFTIAAIMFAATLALAGPAAAAIPQSGYLIFKETRAGSVTEVARRTASSSSPASH